MMITLITILRLVLLVGLIVLVHQQVGSWAMTALLGIGLLGTELVLSHVRQLTLKSQAADEALLGAIKALGEVLEDHEEILDRMEDNHAR